MGYRKDERRLYRRHDTVVEMFDVHERLQDTDRLLRKAVAARDKESFDLYDTQFDILKEVLFGLRRKLGNLDKTAS